MWAKTNRYKNKHLEVRNSNTEKRFSKTNRQEWTSYNECHKVWKALSVFTQTMKRTGVGQCNENKCKRNNWKKISQSPKSAIEIFQILILSTLLKAYFPYEHKIWKDVFLTTEQSWTRVGSIHGPGRVTSQILRNLCGSGRVADQAQIFRNSFWKYTISSCTNNLQLKQVL